MAKINKITVKKVIVKQTYPKYSINNSTYNSDLEKEIRINLIEDLFSEEDDGNLQPRYDIKFINKSGQDPKLLSFTFNRLPHCCGIFEIGDLSIGSLFPTTELTKILDTIVNNITNRTLILSTNGVSTSIWFEKALSECKEWTLVKQFKNSNSGNTVKLWVSNND